MTQEIIERIGNTSRSLFVDKSADNYLSVFNKENDIEVRLFILKEKAFEEIQMYQKEIYESSDESIDSILHKLKSYFSSKLKTSSM